MIQTVFLVINFKSPYHVGWRTVDNIIESFTIHRSLVYTSILIEGNPIRVNELIDLKTSSILPVIRSNECFKILLPLPPIPSRISLKKTGISWITLTALYSILKHISQKGLPFITTATIKDVEETKRGKIIVEFEKEGSEQLCITKKIVHQCSEVFKNIPDELIVKIERHVNRLDRVVNTAEPFRAAGYIPFVEMGLILQGDSELIKYSRGLIKLLGELGIGGLRSRGFGKYSVEEAKLCSDDNKLLQSTSKTGYLIVLGSYKLDSNVIDVEKSIINKKIIGGYAGPPYDPYILPYLNIVGAGSIIRTNKPLDPICECVSKSYTKALLFFNPVTAGA